MLLYDAKLNLAKLLMRVKEGYATEDSVAVTELIDANRNEPADFFFRDLSNGGIIFFPALSESRLITAYDADTGTFDFAPALAAAPDENDVYFASPIDWDSYELVSAINLALEDLGQESGIPQIDETTVIVADQHTYDLPDGVSNVKQVHIILDDDTPEDWTERHMSWDSIGDEIIFDQGSAPSWGDFINLFTVRLMPR